MTACSRPSAHHTVRAIALCALVVAATGPIAAAQTASRSPTTDRTAERTPVPGPFTTTATAAKDGVGATLSLNAPMGWQPGAPVTARIALTLPTGAHVEPPALGDTLGAWDVRHARLEPGATPSQAALEMTLTAWESGPLTVPPIPVQVVLADGSRVALEVGPLEVAIESLLAADAPLTELAAPIRGPVDIRTTRWLWLVAAALGAGITLWLASWLFRRARTAPAAPPLPPGEWAMRELDRLDADGLPARGEFGVFFARLSDIVRQYVEQRWGISAPEQTTKEFLRDAGRNPELAGDHERTLAQFLRSADMVKFAAARPADADCTRAMTLMRDFVRESAPPTVALPVAPAMPGVAHAHSTPPHAQGAQP